MRSFLKQVVSIFLIASVCISPICSTAEFSAPISQADVEQDQSSAAIEPGSVTDYCIDEDESEIDQDAVDRELKEISGQGAMEIMTLREECSKQFQLDDGTYQAVSYSRPVHRKDADGQWQDILMILTTRPCPLRWDRRKVELCYGFRHFSYD